MAHPRPARAESAAFLHQHTTNTTHSVEPSHTAFADLGILYAALVAVGLYVAYIFGSGYMDAYNLKLAMRMACNVQKEEVRMSRFDASKSRWRSDFLTQARILHIDLEDDDYSIEVTRQSDKDFVCKGYGHFFTETSWFLLEDFLDVEPLQLEHNIEVEQVFRGSY